MSDYRRINERLRDKHSNMLPADIPPRMPGTTCPVNLKNLPLWEAIINLDQGMPIKEHLRAESASKAKFYISNKYPRLRSVQITGRLPGR